MGKGEGSSLKQGQHRFRKVSDCSRQRKSRDRTGEKKTGEREKCYVVRNFVWCYRIFGDKLLMSSGVGLPTRLLAPKSALLLYEKFVHYWNAYSILVAVLLLRIFLQNEHTVRAGVSGKNRTNR